MRRHVPTQDLCRIIAVLVAAVVVLPVLSWLVTP